MNKNVSFYYMDEIANISKFKGFPKLQALTLMLLAIGKRNINNREDRS